MGENRVSPRYPSRVGKEAQFSASSIEEPHHQMLGLLINGSVRKQYLQEFGRDDAQMDRGKRGGQAEKHTSEAVAL